MIVSVHAIVAIPPRERITENYMTAFLIGFETTLKCSL